MLSNTAVPKYYGAFRDAVLRGDVPVCEKISKQMNRIDRRIEDPRYYYDDEAIDGVIAFLETEMTLTDGSDMFVLPTFKLWLEDLYAWFKFVERQVWVPNEDGPGGHYETKVIKQRLTNKQYLIVGRGAAKSVYGSDVQSYEESTGGETTHQITTAPTMKQADEIMAPFKTALTRARGPLFKFYTEGSLQNTTGSKRDRVKMASTKKGIENFVTGSLLEVRPMSIDKLQGLRCKVATVDEWLSGDVREDVVGAIEQGASKLDDYIIVAMSSEGTVRNGSGDDIKMELDKILNGEYTADNVSIWWYKLDSIEEVNDPAMWIKANPNIGKTVKYEAYQNDVLRAEQNPSARNDILAKRFGLPMEGFTYFFTYDETLPVASRLDFYGIDCALGADLSQGDDFCAFTFLFPKPNGEFGIKTRAYITERAYQKLTPVMKAKYDEFIQEGSLVIMDGVILDIPLVYDDLDAHIQKNQYNVLCFGYDPYNANEFVQRWATENGPYGIEKVPQGMRTETVPLGEIKKLAEDGLLLFDEVLMTYCMGNCITMEDTNGNRKLLKKRYENKIDCVSALMDAFVAYKRYRDNFE